jgi:HD-GYP domain-containing protein (c-di-GMP phosphodiesterase class II)
MKSLLLSNDLELEMMYLELGIPLDEQLILRSATAALRYSEIFPVSSLIIDSRLLRNEYKKNTRAELASVYDNVISKNPKCFVIILFDQTDPIDRNFEKKNLSTCYVDRHKVNISQLNYLFKIQERQIFRGVYLIDLMKIMRTPVELYLYHPLDDSYRVLLKPADKITHSTMQTLTQNKVTQLFIKNDDFLPFYEADLNYTHLRYSEEMHHIRKKYREFLTELIDDRNKINLASGLKIKQLSDELLELIIKFIGKNRQAHEVIGSLTLLQDHHLSKGINAALYSYALGNELKLKNVKELAECSLYFKIGASLIPPDPITQTIVDERTIRSLRRIENIRVVDYSLKIIESRRVPLSPESLKYIYLHKEHFDGSGYPHGLNGKEIPVEAQLLHFIDLFASQYGFKSHEKFLNIERSFSEVENISLKSVLGNRIAPTLMSRLKQCMQLSD